MDASSEVDESDDDPWRFEYLCARPKLAGKSNYFDWTRDMKSFLGKAWWDIAVGKLSMPAQEDVPDRSPYDTRRAALTKFMAQGPEQRSQGRRWLSTDSMARLTIRNTVEDADRNDRCHTAQEL